MGCSWIAMRCWRSSIASTRKGMRMSAAFISAAGMADTPYTVDRIGRGLDLHVEAVCLSMVGGTQPARISQYLAQVRRGGRGNDGLIQRFSLMVWPDISPAWTNVDRKPDTDAAKAAFHTFQALDALDWHAIGASRDRGVGGDEEGLPYLRLSGEAHDLFVAWREGLEYRLRQGDLDSLLESHLAKYRKLVPGLALIAHLVDTGKGAVSATAMEKALRWAAYLETHAARVYASSSVAAADAAHAIIAKVRSGHLKQQFGSREIIRAQWSRLRDRETVQAALQLLVDHDWLSVTKVEDLGAHRNGLRRESKGSRGRRYEAGGDLTKLTKALLSVLSVLVEARPTRARRLLSVLSGPP